MSEIIHNSQGVSFEIESTAWGIADWICLFYEFCIIYETVFVLLKKLVYPSLFSNSGGCFSQSTSTQKEGIIF